MTANELYDGTAKYWILVAKLLQPQEPLIIVDPGGQQYWAPS